MNIIMVFCRPPEGYNQDTLETLSSMVIHEGECIQSF